MTRLMPILIACTWLAACKKDNTSPTGLVGKWMQTAGYNQGGSTCGCWKNINADFEAFKIEFKLNGTYTMTPPMYYSAMYCPGDYHVKGDSLVWTNGNCTPGTRPTVTHYYKLEDNNTLLIEYSHVPGYLYKLKFKRVARF